MHPYVIERQIRKSVQKIQAFGSSKSSTILRDSRIIGPISSMRSVMDFSSGTFRKNQSGKAGMETHRKQYAFRKDSVGEKWENVTLSLGDSRTFDQGGLDEGT